MQSVLIVEDDRDVREVLAVVLSSVFEVDTAEHGVYALKKLSSRAFDCMVLDLKMPVLNGECVLRAMRIHRVHVPVILVSGSKDLPAHAARLNVSDWLMKPFDVAALIRKIPSVIARRQLVAAASSSPAAR